MKSSFYLLCLLVLIYNVSPAIAGLNKAQEEQLFIADLIYKAMPPVVNKAWEAVKEAEERGELGSERLTKSLLVDDFVLNRLKPLHSQLKLIDSVVEDHSPSTYLNQIINLMELSDLERASDIISRAAEIPIIDYWKEAWVKLSSILLQMHYKYDRIFEHVFVEGYPDPKYVDHELLDDLLTIVENPPEHLLSQLPRNKRLYYTWLRINNIDRGVGYEQYTLSMDELAGFAKKVSSGKDAENNLFVGLRTLLKMHPEIVGPYKDAATFNDTIQCLTDQIYVGISGLDYKIPLYVLLYILNAEMKYYLLRNFAEMYSCINDNKCNWRMVQLLETHLEVYYTFYYTEMMNAFKVADDPIASAPSAAWKYRCDPPPDKNGTRDFKEGESFARFYDFDTKFVAEEQKLSLTQTCRDSCDMIDGAFSSIPCEQEEWACLETDDDFDCLEKHRDEKQCPAPARKICPNEGLLCETTRMRNVEVCPGHSHGRYIDWIKSDGQLYRHLGPDIECDSNIARLRAVQITERSGITRYEPTQCEICMCTCYEPLGNDTHRYISLVPMHSDISKNRVLVGIKFVKVGNQLHLSIADAVTTYNAGVEPETANWISPAAVDPTDATKMFRLSRGAKIILLDDLVSPQGYAITGARFHPLRIPIDRTEVLELGFQIHVTRVSPSGVLIPEDSGWIFNMNDTRFREEVDLNEKEAPVRITSPSRPASQSNSFLEVQSTSVVKDVGQTPLPFFDTQEVLHNESNALVRGIGLYYKAPRGYAGFLGFRVITDIVQDIPQDPRFDWWHFLLMDDFKKENHSIQERPWPEILPYKSIRETRNITTEPAAADLILDAEKTELL